MSNLLISGPAGGGKSQAAQELLADAAKPTVIVDLQALLAALLALQRGVNGRYPPRDGKTDAVLPLVNDIRRSAVFAARADEVDVLYTNSNGDPERRAALLALLGTGATELVIDPGQAIVTARLSDPITGQLTGQCAEAINRWYG